MTTDGAIYERRLGGLLLHVEASLLDGQYVLRAWLTGRPNESVLLADVRRSGLTAAKTALDQELAMLGTGMMLAAGSLTPQSVGVPGE